MISVCVLAELQHVGSVLRVGASLAAHGLEGVGEGVVAVLGDLRGAADGSALPHDTVAYPASAHRQKGQANASARCSGGRRCRPPCAEGGGGGEEGRRAASPGCTNFPTASHRTPRLCAERSASASPLLAAAHQGRSAPHPRPPGKAGMVYPFPLSLSRAVWHKAAHRAPVGRGGGRGTPTPRFVVGGGAEYDRLVLRGVGEGVEV
jgi:hypothetical protein